MNLFYFTKQAPARLFAAIALFSLVAGMLPMQAFAGAPVKQFDASVNPGSIDAGATETFSFTISNEAVSDANIKAARIVIPAGFSGTNLTVSNSQFETTFVGTEIRVSLKPGTGNDGLVPGASMNVGVDLTNNSGSGNSSWQVCAYKNNSFTPAGGADFTYVGGGDCASLGINIVTPVLGCTDATAFNYNPAATVDNGSCIPKVFGCIDPLANNQDTDANTNDGSCTYDVEGCTNPAADNYDPAANVDDGSCIVPVTGCTDPTALNHNPDATDDDGSCILPVEGCTDPLANNHDAAANVNDGSCTYDIEGCTDPLANNYDDAANVDDGSCDFDADPIPGCTDATAFNYNPAATVDNGSCIPKVFGCTDRLADNYDPAANVDDQSCDYDGGDPDPEMCTVTVVSDTSNTVNDSGALLVTPHQAWVASIADSIAQWIWGSPAGSAIDPVNDESQTFEKTFVWNGPVTSATLEISADNYYAVSLNGVEIASTSDEFNYSSTDTIDLSAYIAQGVNTLEITTSNLANGATLYDSNPAGLLYDLTVVGNSDVNCTEVPDGGGDNEVLSCEITVDDSSIRRGGDVTLTWSSIGAAFANLDGDSVDTNDSLLVEDVDEDTTFTLTVYDEQENPAECSVSVDTRSGGGGGGNRAGDRDGRVLGDSDTVEPTPLVLGEQVSAVPTGAPDAGAGGAAPKNVELFTVSSLAILSRARKHG